MAMTQLSPTLDAFGGYMSQAATKPATLETPVNEVEASNEPLTHEMGLSRPNWSLEMPQSEVHG
jgi:hypothetical protein